MLQPLNHHDSPQLDSVQYVSIFLVLRSLLSMLNLSTRMSSSSGLPSLAARMLWETVRGLVSPAFFNIHCDVRVREPAITEGKQVGQARYVCGKSMLSTYLLVLYMAGRGFLQCLLRNFPRDWGESERPVVP